jgi:hypothetical protein
VYQGFQSSEPREETDEIENVQKNVQKGQSSESTLRLSKQQHRVTQETHIPNEAKETKIVQQGSHSSESTTYIPEQQLNEVTKEQNERERCPRDWFLHCFLDILTTSTPSWKKKYVQAISKDLDTATMFALLKA